MEPYGFLKKLNDNQKEICLSNDNFILTACPGSGKTRTITYRLAYLAQKNESSNLFNIALTYTNRAADEIETRLLDLGIDTSNIWTGTIHSFCLQFIIRPYANYHSNLSKGYRIIDEYIRDEYIKNIAEELKINGYIDDLRSNPLIREKYYELLTKNKEIDFDLILSYSYELVSAHRFIAENISHIIRSIHVDEFQDTNEAQYQILSCLICENPSINILFVGDTNQAIYTGLGGVAKTAKEIRDLYRVPFTEKCLDGCYRSTQRMVNLYTNFEVSPTGVFSVAEYKEQLGTFKYDNKIDKDDLVAKIAEILRSELACGMPENEICIVAPTWFKIFPFTNQLKRVMPEAEFDAPDISPIKRDPLNVFYLISKLLFTQYSGRITGRKRTATDILNILHMDFGVLMPNYADNYLVLRAINATQANQADGISTIKMAVKNLWHSLKISIEDYPLLKSTYRDFVDKIVSRIKQFDLSFDYVSMEKCFMERKGIVINTIHGVKGEEYTTMIGFSLLHGVIPNWKITRETICHDETCKLLYVMCSRAKKNLYLFSESGYFTRGYNPKPYTATNELKMCDFNYDI